MVLVKRTACLVTTFALGLFLTQAAAAQHVRGELRVEVHDPQGSAVASDAEIQSDGNEFRLAFQVTDGRYVVQDLPFGIYRLSVDSPGFASWSGLVTGA